MNALVLPTNRQNHLHRFLQDWQHENWQIIVVEDNPEKTFQVPSHVQHYSHAEIDNELREDAWIISRKDSAIRSFGYLMAAKAGAQFIFSLDDDCLPLSCSGRHRIVCYIDEHIKHLTETTRWTESVPGFRTRGIPYKNLGKHKNVVLNMGLWQGVPDFDAVQTLSNSPPLELPNFNRIIPRNQYFPLCGMNFCFKREIAPLMYFGLMGAGNGYHRFDDIWAGIICKKICDHLDLAISVGKPFVYHSRASNVFVNLEKEARGIGLNESFWELIDGILLTKFTPRDCMIELGKKLAKLRSQDTEYTRKLGTAIEIWANLFE